MITSVRIISSEPFEELFDYSDKYVDPAIVETIYPKLILSLVDVAVWGEGYQQFLKFPPKEILDLVGFPIDVKYHVYNLTVKSIREFVSKALTDYRIDDLIDVELKAGWSWVISGVTYANDRKVPNLQVKGRHRYK